MGKLDGRVAFITGAARGQGRSHAVRFAEEGADVVGIDICAEIDSAFYSLATEDDLWETQRLVEATGRRMIALKGDVRSQEAMDAAVAAALNEFGRLDIVLANAGMASVGLTWELGEAQWQDVIDVLLTGVWHTVKAAIPAMLEADRGGSIVLTSSAAGMKVVGNTAHYVAAKQGVLGLMKTLAHELAPHSIRVNAVAPATTQTDMAVNDSTRKLFRPEVEEPTLDDMAEVLLTLHAMPVPFIQPIDISNALLWLCSDEARYVTGIVLPVDAGWLVK